MTEPLPLRRWVVDTNVMVSWALRTHSPTGLVVQAALASGRLLFSRSTYEELVSVVRRPKFDAYGPTTERLKTLGLLDELIDWVQPGRPIRACRDPKDDHILEAAVYGAADAILTGDADLLALHPFHGVPILAPADFAAHCAALR